MGFFRRLIYGKKNQYEEQISNGEDGSFESQIVNVKDPVARNQYVDTCIEQISEAVDNIDSLTREYETVTTYLTDMEELEALPEPNMQEIREQAAKILQLSMSKDSYQSRQDRMKESDYRRMQGLEEEVQEGYRKLRDAETYQEKVKQDLRRLDGEKHACEFRQRQWAATIMNTRGMAIICLVAVAMCVLMLAVLQFGFDMDTQIGYLLTAAAAAIAITVIYVKHGDAKAEYEKTGRTINRLILLQNKVKIRYVNNTNLLDYLKLKYGVDRAETLNRMWEQYLEEKELRQIQEETEEELRFCNQDLLRTLRQYQIKIPEIWPSQVMALVNKKEMVEVRHSLISRRQSLRKQLEYNRELAQKAQNIIKQIANDYPQDAKDILQKVSGKI